MSDIKMSNVFGSSLNEDPVNRIVTALVLFGPEKDAAIHAISNHDTLTQQNKALSNEIDTLNEEIANLKMSVDEVSVLIDSSDGVAGLHQNGDIAEWSTLLEGGHFEEWLEHFSKALKGDL